MASLSLDECLDLWRATRAAEVADLVDSLSQRLPPVKLYTASANMAAKQRAWLDKALAKEPVSLPSLLATLHDAHSGDVEKRLELLAEWPDDPRTASHLTSIYERPSHLNVSTLPMWERLSELLVRLVDPRSAARLDAVAAGGDAFVALFRPHMRPEFRSHLARVRAALTDALARSTWRALTTAERDAIRRARPTSTEAELLASVLAAPDDDQRLNVYADALLERGDGRGELIQLQTSGPADAAGRERIEALLGKHRKSWLGRLASVVDVKSAEFERGFPAKVRIKVSSHRQLSPMLGAPEWNTVHTVDFDLGRGGPLELLLHPSMTRLRAAEGLQSDDVRRLARAGKVLCIRRLSFLWDRKPGSLAALEAAAFDRLKDLLVMLDGDARPNGPETEKVLAWAAAGGKRFDVSVVIVPSKR